MARELPVIRPHALPMIDSRARLLRAAVGFALVPQDEPELQLLRRRARLLARRRRCGAGHAGFTLWPTSASSPAECERPELLDGHRANTEALLKQPPTITTPLPNGL